MKVDFESTRNKESVQINDMMTVERIILNAI
jgi:hypothetical protein